MDSEFRIYRTDEVLNKWTQKEVENFKKKLNKQINLIGRNPKLFPLSDYNKRLRKAVLSKQTTIFYELSGSVIYLVYLFNNKQDIKRIK